ncbi:MAG: hypothetical protein ACXVYM_02535 [Gaiellaceae bacterium]
MRSERPLEQRRTERADPQLRCAAEQAVRGGLPEREIKLLLRRQLRVLDERPLARAA